MTDTDIALALEQTKKAEKVIKELKELRKLREMDINDIRFASIQDSYINNSDHLYPSCPIFNQLTTIYHNYLDPEIAKCEKELSEILNLGE